MHDNYRNYFQIRSNGSNQLVYEDSSCKVEVNVPDFRERVWWTSIACVINNKSNRIEKVTKEQKLEIYKRISAYVIDRGVSGIYTDEFHFVEVKFSDLDYSISILDM